MLEPRRRLLAVIFSRRMVVSFAMGIACGLPLLLTMGVLQAWMTEAQVDLTWVGMITLVQIPYSWKFLWAPLLDRYSLPLLGRRRGWLLVAQLLLAGSIVALGFSDPTQHPVAMVVSAMLVAFFSATQDVVVDAYRREDLADDELGLGSSLYVYGYRIGMWASSGGALILADHIPFGRVYLLMACGMLFGIARDAARPGAARRCRPAAHAAGGDVEPPLPTSSAARGSAGSSPSSCSTRSATPWRPRSQRRFTWSSGSPSPRSGRS